MTNHAYKHMRAQNSFNYQKQKNTRPQKRNSWKDFSSAAVLCSRTKTTLTEAKLIVHQNNMYLSVHVLFRSKVEERFLMLASFSEESPCHIFLFIERSECGPHGSSDRTEMKNLIRAIKAPSHILFWEDELFITKFSGVNDQDPTHGDSVSANMLCLCQSCSLQYCCCMSEHLNRKRQDFQQENASRKACDLWTLWCALQETAPHMGN